MHSEGPEPHSLFWMGRAPPDADSVCELQSVVVAARACVAPSAASNTAARAVANAVPAVMRRFGSAMLVPFPLGPAPGPGGGGPRLGQRAGRRVGRGHANSPSDEVKSRFANAGPAAGQRRYVT